jgi:hypothetical protein
MKPQIEPLFVALACLTTLGVSLAGNWWAGGTLDFGLAFATTAAAGVGWALYTAGRATARTAARWRGASLCTAIVALVLGGSGLARESPWDAAPVVAAWLAVAAGFTGLYLHQRRRDGATGGG